MRQLHGRLGLIRLGSFFKYQCPGCAYEATVSGGYDRGFEIHTVTISCEVCMEIMDLTIPRENWVKGVDAGLAKQPDPQVFCCKVCDNQTCPPWKSDCPKCGERLERVSLVMDWD